MYGICAPSPTEASHKDPDSSRRAELKPLMILIRTSRKEIIRIALDLFLFLRFLPLFFSRYGGICFCKTRLLFRCGYISRGISAVVRCGGDAKYDATFCFHDLLCTYDQAVLVDCLRRLRVVRPDGLFELLAAIEVLKHEVEHRPAVVVVDGMGSFFWQDKVI